MGTSKSFKLNGSKKHRPCRTFCWCTYRRINFAYYPKYLEVEGLSPSIIKTWVSLAGPLAFNPLKTNSIRPIFETIKDDIKQAQPINFSRKNSRPAVLFHGKKDTTVYEKNSILTAMALKKNENKVIQKSFASIGHIGLLLSIAKPDLFGVDLYWIVGIRDNYTRFPNCQNPKIEILLCKN